MHIIEALTKAKIASLDAEVLLAHILERDRAWLLAHGEYELTAQQSEAFARAVERRKNHEPVAYITGTREFYGRVFNVSSDVLVPRPATEGLVDLVLDTFNQSTEDTVRDIDTEIVAASKIWESLTDVHTIVDVGTGSGCIAITLACERPDLKFIAVDVSEEALEVAQQNANKHAVAHRIEFKHGSLLEPVLDLTEPFIVVSNPPYIPDAEVLPPDVDNHEPTLALRAGPDGTDIIKELSRQAHAYTQCHGVFIECREDQVSSIL